MSYRQEVFDATRSAVRDAVSGGAIADAARSAIGDAARSAISASDIQEGVKNAIIFGIQTGMIDINADTIAEALKTQMEIYRQETIRWSDAEKKTKIEHQAETDRLKKELDYIKQKTVTETLELAATISKEAWNDSDTMVNQKEQSDRMVRIFEDLTADSRKKEAEISS